MKSKFSELGIVVCYIWAYSCSQTDSPISAPTETLVESTTSVPSPEELACILDDYNTEIAIVELAFIETHIDFHQIRKDVVIVHKQTLEQAKCYHNSMTEETP